MRRIILLVVSIVVCQITWGQNLAYRADFNMFFDNLENSYQPTRTLFAISLTPEVGLSWDGGHSLMVGASMIQDLGDSTFLTKADYIAYYNYNGDKASIFAGAFPRRYSIANYPKSFYSEASRFYDPTLMGIMFQYRTAKGGYIELFADWFGASQKLRIDEFMISGSTEQRLFDETLLVGGNFQLMHFKNDYYLEDSYLYESLLYNVYAGVNLKKFMPYMDEARATLGLLGSNEHKRVLETQTKWVNFPGGIFDIAFRWKGIGLSNSLYFGNGQMAYYPQYGEGKIYRGSPFYMSDLYNRTDLYYLWERRYVGIKANMIFNATEYGLSTQQMLTVNVNISKLLEKGKSIDYNQYSQYPW